MKRLTLMIYQLYNNDSYEKLLNDTEIECLLKIMNLNIPMNLKNKATIVSSICRLMLIDSNFNSINEFKSGLNVHGIISNCKGSPHFRNLFQHDGNKNLTSIVMSKLVSER